MDAGQGGGEKYSNPNLHFEVSGGWDESASVHAVDSASAVVGPGSPSIGGTSTVTAAGTTATGSASGVGGDDDDACEQVSSESESLPVPVARASPGRTGRPPRPPGAQPEDARAVALAA